MRLGTCLALEVLCAGALTAAVWVGGRYGLAEISGTIRGAEAAENASAPPIDREAGEVGRIETVGVFDGVSDEVLLAPLRTGAIRSVKFNRGGSSISLRVDFDNGSRAAFKPRQISEHSVPRYEVAAFRINRLLGLSSVAPAIGRSFAVADVLDALRPDSRGFAPRMREEMVTEGDRVIGELSWWIPVIEPARIEGRMIDSVEGVLTWDQYLDAGAPIPADEWNLVAQISDMVTFDFVVGNHDRFSGRNVWVSADRRVLYFMDNTAAFNLDTDGTYKSQAYLSKVEKFSRSLIASLRGLSRERLTAELGREVAPFEHLLTGDEIDAVLGRRAHVIARVDALIAKHGVEKVLVFP